MMTREVVALIAVALVGTLGGEIFRLVRARLVEPQLDRRSKARKHRAWLKTTLESMAREFEPNTGGCSLVDRVARIEERVSEERADHDRIHAALRDNEADHREIKATLERLGQDPD